MKKLFMMYLLVISIVMGFSSISLAQDEVSADAKALGSKMWEETKSSLLLLGVADSDSFKDKYIKSLDRVLKRVDALPQEKKNAILKADKPLQAIFKLNINKDLKGSQRIFPPSIESYTKLFDHPNLSTEEAANLIKSITGTWNNEWKSAKETRNWVVDANGKVVANGTRRGKAEEQTELTLNFRQKNRVSVKKGSSSQTYVFFQHGGKFYVSSNILYDAFPFSDRNKFVAKNKRDFVVYDNGKCSVITESGALAPAQCAYEKDEGADVFKVSYKFDGEVNHLDKPKSNEFKFYVLGDHMASEALVESGTFTKK